jgi:adenosylcobinamide-GDP ribazoletransferase
MGNLLRSLFTILSSFWLALGFLTVLPARQVEFRPGALGQAGAWFPFVGLLMGALLTGVFWLSDQLFPPLLVGGLTTAAWALLTGALHLDGFADCCDGLLASTTPQRRLEIMRDPRTGAFAVAGLALLLLLKTAAIASLAAPIPALLLTPVYGRWLILLVAHQKPAQKSGMGVDFAAGLTPTVLAAALIVPVGLFLVFFSGRTYMAVLLAHIVARLLVSAAERRLGGVTGDVFGMTVELAEATMLLVFAAQW